MKTTEKLEKISFRYIDALELLKDDENRLKILIEKLRKLFFKAYEI
jgi:hypothetical protein